MNTDQDYMRLALEEAKKAFAKEEVPIGAVIVKDKEVVAKAHNLKERLQDPTAHAEVLVVKKAAQALASWRLINCSLYVTIEPCSMCAGTLVQSRVEQLVYGARDPKGGAAGSIFNIVDNDKLNHKLSVKSGVLKEECSQLMKDFFKQLR
ncbi:tRNA adenosine(34) deaminase TadA [Halanaerobaculum tunisiense]